MDFSGTLLLVQKWQETEMKTWETILISVLQNLF